MKLRALGALLALSFFPVSAWAYRRQVPMADFVQDVWDVGENGNGLPHPAVTSIVQTRDGYIWLGTFGGVARFDGLRFDPPEVANDRVRVVLAGHIQAIHEGLDGSMWFGTRRAGVVRLNPKDGEGEVLTKKTGLADDNVRIVAETPDGTMWFGTTEGLTARRASGELRTFGTKEGLPTKNIVSLFVDAGGTLWAGTTELGVAYLDGTRFQTVPLSIPKGTNVVDLAYGVPIRGVGAIAREGDRLLVGTSAGLVRIPRQGGVATAVLPGAVGLLVPGRNDSHWVGTGSGIARVDASGARAYNSEQGLLNDTIMALLEDREGSLWVGTRVGLARLRPRLIRSYTRHDGLAHDSTTCVLEARDGAIWTGHRNGVSRLSATGWSNFGIAQGLPNASIRALAESPDGSIWIGTLDGVARFKDGRITALRGEGETYSVRALTVDDAGRILVGTPYGLDRIEGSTVTRLADQGHLCGMTQPNYLYVAADSTIWVGGSTALASVRGDNVECVKASEVASQNDVRYITANPQGGLWVGTASAITRVVDGKRESLTGGPGPFGTAAYAVIDDSHGWLWTNTPKGIFRINRAKIDLYKSSSEAIYRSFGIADGMDTPVGTGGGQPSAFQGRDGRLWFTSATGLTVIDPARLQEDDYTAPIYVERLLADREPVGLANARLNAGTRDVEIHFGMLSFIAPEQLKYKYRLEGYDASWVDSGSRRVAYYTNLSPGQYRFRVVAANHNGVWNNDGASLDLTLQPHFYQRGFFIPSMVLVAIALGLGLHQLRTARMRANEIQLKRRIDEAVANVQMLRGMLPICASCRKVREDTGYWRQIEAYVMEHTDATFSHSICPECWEKMRQEDPGLPAYSRGQN
jgi:ligand-binding sensor domain-containing protein